MCRLPSILPYRLFQSAFLTKTPRKVKLNKNYFSIKRLGSRCETQNFSRPIEHDFDIIRRVMMMKRCKLSGRRLRKNFNDCQIAANKTRRMFSSCLLSSSANMAEGMAQRWRVRFVCGKVCNLSSDKSPILPTFLLFSVLAVGSRRRREEIEEVEMVSTWCIRYTNIPIRYDYSAHKNNFWIQISYVFLLFFSLFFIRHGKACPPPLVPLGEVKEKLFHPSQNNMSFAFPFRIAKFFLLPL